MHIHDTAKLPNYKMEKLAIYSINPIKCPGTVAFYEKGGVGALFRAKRVVNPFVINTICTLKCLNIGTPKTINFPFVPNGKLMVFGRLNI